ncbi:heme-binding protein [Mycobacterium sp. GA-2829]|uniref:heme-binding protein n=1 Tax=Mycobacterium sp. GA-2829 TaxID=1772283 RepID=UPI000B31519C
MSHSDHVIRKTLTIMGIGAVLLAGSASATAQPAPPPPGCTAGDLAQVSGAVGTAMANYLFSHPDVNTFFTSLRGLPNEEVRGRVQDYMTANRQVEAEINGIRQPLTDLRNRCDAPAPAGPLGPP